MRTTVDRSASAAIITAPPPPRLIPRSDYGVSFWVEVILSKYRYAQPNNRYLQDLKDQGLPVSPGTLAGGLQALAPLFKPVLEALYRKQMGEQLFHNDETRWEVFVEIEGKVGMCWYLWVTRSASVIFYCIDPSRSAAVPGAHFAGLQTEKVIVVCDRYSAYKKLARLAENILLAFCWAHYPAPCFIRSHGALLLSLLAVRRCLTRYKNALDADNRGIRLRRGLSVV